MFGLDFRKVLRFVLSPFQRGLLGGVILGLEERRPDYHCTRLEEGDLNCRELREEPLGRLPR